MSPWPFRGSFKGVLQGAPVLLGGPLRATITESLSRSFIWVLQGGAARNRDVCSAWRTRWVGGSYWKGCVGGYWKTPPPPRGVILGLNRRPKRPKNSCSMFCLWVTLGGGWVSPQQPTEGPKHLKEQGFGLIWNTCVEIWLVVVANQGIFTPHLARKSAVKQSHFLQHIAIYCGHFLHSFLGSLLVPKHQEFELGSTLCAVSLARYDPFHL